MYSTKYGRHAVRLAGWHASHVAYRFVRTLGIHQLPLVPLVAPLC